MKDTYIIDYVNENEFRKRERNLKKYNMLAYKKLLFEYYPALREGDFKGILVSSDKKNEIYKYELKLPTDRNFARVYSDIILCYTVYKTNKTIMLENILPDDILSEDHRKELQTYKGIPISKSHAEKDMFKINLLNILGDK